MLDNGEFYELLIPCFAQTIDKFGILLPKALKDTLCARLSKVRANAPAELAPPLKMELGRLIERLNT
jgi:hypothetical protein